MNTQRFTATIVSYSGGTEELTFKKETAEEALIEAEDRAMDLGGNDFTSESYVSQVKDQAGNVVWTYNDGFTEDQEAAPY